MRADNARLDKAMKEIKQKNLALEKEMKGLREERDQNHDELTRAKEVVV